MAWQRLRREIIKARFMYLLILPALIFLLLFVYQPILRGFGMSLYEFRLRGAGDFVGLTHYRQAVVDPNFWRVLQNTLWIGGGTLIISFVLQIVMALLLNEILQLTLRRAIQTVIYLPHLFSWVVVGGIWISLLAPDTGLVNGLLRAIGQEPIYFMARESWSLPVFIFTGVWKSVGYGCIIFLAAITKINPHLYEAASIDGANRWHQTLNVTLPGIYSTALVVFLLNLLGVLRIFDQSFVMTNPAIINRTDVLMTYTYRLGILQFRMDYAAAVAYIVLVLTALLTLLYFSVNRSAVLD
jgi:putative aldouronate transport system permease protein